jgi:hypothetical protein
MFAAIGAPIVPAPKTATLTPSRLPGRHEPTHDRRRPRRGFAAAFTNLLASALLGEPTNPTPEARPERERSEAKDK